MPKPPAPVPVTHPRPKPVTQATLVLGLLPIAARPFDLERRRVTLVGLSCGLDLPHVAVMATLFGWVLIYVLEWRITYQIDIRALPKDRMMEAMDAYREALESQGCSIIGERKRPDTGRVRFTFRPGAGNGQRDIQEYLETQVDPSLRGTTDRFVLRFRKPG